MLDMSKMLNGLPKSNQCWINPTAESLQRERNKFVLDRSGENPVFDYANEYKAEELFRAHRKPHTEYLDAAVRVMEACLAVHGSESRYLSEVGDMIATEAMCLSSIESWLDENQLHGEVKLHLNPNNVAGASMQGHIFHVAMPVQLRLHKINSTCNHEIGTHYLRAQNEKLQKWHKNREKFGLGEHLISEEGLACLNTHLESDKHMWKAALHYYTAVQGSRMSFGNLYTDLLQYLDDPESAWRQCVRFKRGLIDTTVGGAYCRDQCYFIGALGILKRRHTIDFRKFHCGKITIEAYPSLKKHIVTQGARHPRFLEDPARYSTLLEEIIETNGLREFCGDGKEI